MARRSNNGDMDGVEKPTSGPVPLSGFVAFKTHSSRNRLRNKTWRTGVPVDLVQGEGLTGFRTAPSSSPLEPVEPAAPPLLQPSQARSTPFTLPKIQTDLQPDDEAPVQMDILGEQQPVSKWGAGLAELPAPPSEDSDDVSPTDTRPPAVENHLRLFGQLPDIIRLQEQTGDFDGQIVFIGHPNRDVSAHQWISASYQWINVGLWSHTRKRIEGSLASDRLPTSEFSFDSVEYFKFAAEHREAMIKQHGRPRTNPETTNTEPTPTESSTDHTSEAPVGSFAATSVRTVTGEELEDPFITPANILQPAPMVAFNFRGTGALGAALDYGFEFPRKTGAANKEHQQIYVQRERVRLEALRGQSLAHREVQTPQTPIRDVEFGESGLSPPTAHGTVHRHDTLLSSGDVQNRLQARSRLAELGRAGSQPNLTPEQRVAVPDFPLNNVNFRNSIPSGPTVANPYRGMSTLNAAAPPYRMPPKAPSSDKSDSSVTALNIPAPATDPALRFSDPDGRQEHVPPIANGFNKQAPTRQNWKGPFFADSMPTTHDPLASLSAQISNEQKLTNWYRGGQSVIRQQDYAKTLVAAASASEKARSFGVIGHGSARKQHLSKHANTHLFARVYEHLSEYAEESRAGGGQSYFTRAWKPPALHLRDFGSDGNNSFYSSMSTPSPHMSRTINRPYQPYRGDGIPWGFGASASNLAPPQYAPSSVTSGAFGGSQPRGH
ncbi:hypothetical protein PMIN01_07055 [Paraphaeosphaeria minitans]|uniref:Uncharacterized protein n=1 Tax=Paraphaeosphaeria minitans TaxID=565426 RepID=A0A9P6GJR7_9PLEO|nr:hypothetical protein PMIN01_07055 [Paraphaeosphaeria minitans]